MNRSFQSNGTEEDRNQVQDVLETYVREGAWQMLASVLEEEVNAVPVRHRYARGAPFKEIEESKT